MLALIIEMAPQLREVGVHNVDLGGVVFSVQPKQAKAPAQSQSLEQSLNHATSDPLEDPATFGGRRLPGFERFRPDWESGVS